MFKYIIISFFHFILFFVNIKTSNVEVSINLFIDDYLDGVYVNGIKTFTGNDETKHYTFSISTTIGSYLEIYYSDFQSGAGISLKITFNNNGVIETYKTDYSSIFLWYTNTTSSHHSALRNISLIPYEYTYYDSWTSEMTGAYIIGETNALHPPTPDKRYKSYMNKIYIPNTIACGLKNLILDDNRKSKKIDMNKLLYLGNTDVYTNKMQFKILSTSFYHDDGATVNYLFLSDGTPITIGTIYDVNVLLYSSLGYGILDEIKYIGIYKNESNSNPQIETIECVIYATTCYETCSRCNPIPPTKESQQCTSCKSGYVLDSNNNCNVNCTEKNTYSYYICGQYTCKDENEDGNIVDTDTYCLRLCKDIDCKKCEYQENYEEVCVDCYEGYTMTEEGQCQLGNSKDGYYLDTSSEPNILRKCYETCSKCSGAGNYENPNCISTECADDAYYLHEDKTKCYFSPLEGYRLIGDEWYNETLCPNVCETCTETLVEGLMNCLTCIDGYYKLENNLTECYEGSSEIDGYYFDVDIFKKCYLSCETCSNPSYLYNHNCKVCKENYKNLEDNSTQCYENPPDGYYNSDLNDESFLLCNENCATCSEGSTEDSMNCLTCKSGYKYLIDNSKECYNSPPDGYANDPENSLYYEKCHSNCKTCSAKPNHLMNCVECKDNYIKLYNNLTECYLKTEEIDNYYYDSDSNLFLSCEGKNKFYTNSLGIKICTENCPEDYEYFISDTNQCVSDCNANGYLTENLNCVSSCSSNYIQNDNICEFHEEEIEENNEENHEENHEEIHEENKEENNEENHEENPEEKKEDMKNQKISNNLINEFSKDILSYDLNTEIEGEDFSMVITKTSNSSSSVQLSDDCLKTLKEIYHIDENEDLLILLINIESNTDDNSLIDGIRYKIFSPSGEELDLKHCKNSNTIVKYSLNTSNLLYNLTLAKELYEQGYDMFSTSSDFFKDICSPYKDDNNNDVTLEKRREDLFYNVSLCEDDCTLIEINFTSFESVCNCSIQEECDVENVNETTVNNEKNVFENVLPKTNLYLVKCYKTYYHFRNLKKNISFWFFLGCFLLELILFFYYIIDGMRYIEAKVNEFIVKKERKIKNDFKHALNELKNLYINNPPKKEIQFSETNLMEDNENAQSKNSKHKNKNSKKKKLQKNSNKIYVYSNNSFKTSNKLNSSYEHKKTNTNDIILDKDEKPYENENDNKKQIYDFIIKNDDLVSCPYSVAIKEDKRNFCTSFCDNFKDNQSLLKAIIKQSIYELICVKLSGYIFSLCLDFFLNAVFFTDDVVDEKYQNQNLSLLTDFLKSFYSCLVGLLICKISLNFADNFQFFELLEKEYSYSKKYLLIIDLYFKKINRKIIYFFCSIMLFTLFFLYYCTIFCYVYNGSQLEWFKGGWYSFLISFITTFVLCLINSIIRYYALKKKSKYAYNTCIFMNLYM